MLKEHEAIRGLPRIDVDEVDRNLAAGWTLPATLYTDPAVARLEDEVIWKPGWQVVGTLADFRNTGDYLTVLLGRFPVLIVRGKDGELRAFLNVCRHRGALVVGGERGDVSDGVSGNCNRFKCLYHGWTYGLDGGLLGAPDSKGRNLPPFSELGLHAISVDTWAGWVFVSIAPSEPLDSFLGDVPAIADANNYDYPLLNDDEVRYAGTVEFDVKANWKLFMENNLECYHCSTTHENTLGALYKVDTGTFCNVNYRNGNHISTSFSDDLGELIEPDAAARLNQAVATSRATPFQQYWFWPTNMITAGVGLGNTLSRIDPVDADHCRIVSRVYVGSEDTQDAERMEKFLEDIVAEDVAISGGVHTGLRSGAREWGPLLSGREDSIEWFSAMTWSHLAPAFRAATESRAG
jgi:phenylpropionate dioxygenase-like ring-hydroxylating dioxygenase large terminal subunit